MNSTPTRKTYLLDRFTPLISSSNSLQNPQSPPHNSYQQLLQPQSPQPLLQFTPPKKQQKIPQKNKPKLTQKISSNDIIIRPNYNLIDIKKNSLIAIKNKAYLLNNDQLEFNNKNQILELCFSHITYVFQNKYKNVCDSVGKLHVFQEKEKIQEYIFNNQKINHISQLDDQNISVSSNNQQFLIDYRQKSQILLKQFDQSISCTQQISQNVIAVATDKLYLCDIRKNAFFQQINIPYINSMYFYQNNLYIGSNDKLRKFDAINQIFQIIDQNVQNIFGYEDQIYGIANNSIIKWNQDLNFICSWKGNSLYGSSFGKKVIGINYREILMWEFSEENIIENMLGWEISTLR